MDIAYKSHYLMIVSNVHDLIGPAREGRISRVAGASKTPSTGRVTELSSTLSDGRQGSGASGAAVRPDTESAGRSAGRSGGQSGTHHSRKRDALKLLNITCAT